jgi:hypothetical protein
MTQKIGHFLQGLSSSFDITGSSFIEVPDLTKGFERDREALYGDWKRIGNDIGSAINMVVNE